LGEVDVAWADWLVTALVTTLVTADLLVTAEVAVALLVTALVTAEETGDAVAATELAAADEVSALVEAAGEETTDVDEAGEPGMTVAPGPPMMAGMAIPGHWDTRAVWPGLYWLHPGSALRFERTSSSTTGASLHLLALSLFSDAANGAHSVILIRQ
jgi:hypothetical protein